jgi:peptide methionine sulfoxide reductase MsrA
MYYSNDEEKQILEKSKKTLEDSGKFDKAIVTKVIPVSEFFKAEEYHQDYYKKSSFRYNAYKKGSGRKDFIDDNWEDKIEELSRETAEENP